MRFLIFFLLLFGLNTAFAQEQSDSIYVAKSFLGYKFYQHDARVNMNTLPLLMQDNSEALRLTTKARKNNILSSIISGTGGFLIGWQLATAIVGGEPNWTMAAVGGGLIVVSIPITSRAFKQSLAGIDIYNSGLVESSHRMILDFGLVQNGLGLKLVF